MDKDIKEIKKGNLTYKLGYELIDDKVYPYIEIYMDSNILS